MWIITAAAAGLLGGGAEGLKAFRVQTHQELLVTHDCGPCGALRGVRTAVRVPRNAKLLSVPLDACLSVRRAPNDDEHLALALLSAVEADPRWKSYRRLLPTDTNAAFTWSQAEIEQLHLPDAVELALELRSRCDSAGQLHGVRQEEWIWAYSIVYSRSFVIDDGMQPARALAPFLDLLNHQPESPVQFAERDALWRRDGFSEVPSPWRLVDERATLALFAECDLAAGEEVLLPYGVERSCELAVTSGFVPDPNEADYYPIWVDSTELVRTCQ